MNKTTAALAAAAAVGITALTVAPASAEPHQNNLSCTYKNGATPINGAAVATHSGGNSDRDRFDAIISMSDGSGRTWHWDLYHGTVANPPSQNAGSHSAGGTKVGNFQIERSMIDWYGEDKVMAVVESASGNVRCIGWANW